MAITIKTKSAVLVLWCHLELNQGHTDFQSVALPTELWHLVFSNALQK